MSTSFSLNGENVICFGDSLTYGTGAAQGMDYPSQLARLIDLPVINAGIPGDTTATALDRVHEDVVMQSPRFVLITLGGNDLKNGVSREEAFSNLRSIITTLQEQNALVIIGSIDLPLFDRGFGKAYQDLADETGAVLIPDIYQGIMNNPALMSDRIHPNGTGYAIMAGRFFEAMQPFL
ncbi:MAG: GDSL-type esterase/lipase family protein [Desulfovibrionales bacterium]